MSEKFYRQQVVKALRTQGMDPISVENKVHPGTPDVNYSGGWIELKVIKDWPILDETPVRCKTFTPQQRIWLRRRWKAGGRAHLLVRIDKEHLLFNGEDAADYFGNTRKEILEDLAIMHTKGLNGQTLVQCLLAGALERRRRD